MWLVHKVFSHSAFTSHWTSIITVWLPPAPLLCITVIIVKQAFGNHRLLASYGGKPIGGVGT